MEAILYDGNKVIAKSNSVDFAVNKKSDEDYIYGGRDKYKIYPYIKKSSWFEIELKDVFHYLSQVQINVNILIINTN